MKEPKIREVVPGLEEYCFDTIEELQDFFVSAWKNKKFEGMRTKAIGTKFYAWKRDA